MTRGRRPRTLEHITANTGFNETRRAPNAERDQHLVALIADGCVASWHEFVTGYTNLILKVLRQVLFVEDDDEIHGVYVDLLEELHGNKLSKYEGRAALSTWLVLITRGFALDYLRHKRGRQRLPRGYDRLSELEQQVYRWHFVEGVSFDSVLLALNIGRNVATNNDLTAAIRTIEETIDARTLRRLDRERAARHAGHGSWRELEYFHHLRLEYSRRSEENGGEAIRRMETEETKKRLASIRSTLPEKEQEVVHLRFHEGLTAGEISKRVGWATPRKVYSLIESALNKFRKEMIGSTEK